MSSQIGKEALRVNLLPLARVCARTVRAVKDVLVDAKNLHDGSTHFSHVDASTTRASGVTRRAAYELSAMHLDEQHHGTVLGM
eukprot:4722143-Prymnesium_polylepis.1